VLGEDLGEAVGVAHDVGEAALPLGVGLLEHVAAEDAGAQAEGAAGLLRNTASRVEARVSEGGGAARFEVRVGTFAMAVWSPVTILTGMPISMAFAMVSFVSSRGGSKRDRTPRNSHSSLSLVRATPRAL
jgi:hypothetical protein